MRRVINAACLLAEPALQEPVFLGNGVPSQSTDVRTEYSAVEIQCPEATIGSIYSTLARRRGRVISEEPRVGTPLYNVKAYLPVAESIGFADELRGATQGRAFPQCVFDHWETCVCSTLSPASCQLTLLQIARLYGSSVSAAGRRLTEISAPMDPGSKSEELVQKIRRRKGLDVRATFAKRTGEN